jgi:hypothetical protein
MTFMNSPRSLGSAASCGDDNVSASRLSPGATRSIGALICSTRASAVFIVRVIWGIIARIGGSTSSSSRFTRPAIWLSWAIVSLKFSTAARKSATPRWNCPIDLEMPASGFDPPNIMNRSPRPGLDDASDMGSP